jgi:hypothetical protein
MEIIAEVTCSTSADVPVTSVDEFLGTERAHAYLINHGAHGYAKFILDAKTISALETSLHLIKSSLDRKQIYNILFDMVKNGKIPGIQVLTIIQNNT